MGHPKDKNTHLGAYPLILFAWVLQVILGDTRNFLEQYSCVDEPFCNSDVFSPRKERSLRRTYLLDYREPLRSSCN